MEKETRDLVFATCLLIWTGMQVWDFIEIRVEKHQLNEVLKNEQKLADRRLQEIRDKKIFIDAKRETDRQKRKAIEAEKERNKIKYSWDPESKNKELEKRKLEAEERNKQKDKERRSKSLKGLN